MTEQQNPDHILLGTLYLSTAVTGLIDATSFLGIGHIFTANMTGNIVLLAFATAHVSGLSIARSLSALAAFLVGGLMGGRIAASTRFQAIRSLAKIAFGIEALLLLSAALASIGVIDTSVNSSHVYAVIVLTALAMGARNAAVRKMAVPDLTTTVLTLTVTGLAADSSLAGGSNQRWQRRLLSILLMFLGAAVGAQLVKHSLVLPLAVATFLSFGCLALLWGAALVPTTGKEPLIRCDRLIQLPASIGGCTDNRALVVAVLSDLRNGIVAFHYEKAPTPELT